MLFDIHYENIFLFISYFFSYVIYDYITSYNFNTFSLSYIPMCLKGVSWKW